MRNVIYKFAFDTNGYGVLAATKFLDAQLQGDRVTVWYEVGDDSDLWEIYLVGTGWPVPEGATYIGTVQQGAYVWHVYGGKVEERTEEDIIEETFERR